MELSDVTEKTPATPGIDPGTFRLVAQCLNHYVTPGANGLLEKRNGSVADVEDRNKPALQ
jgi:hypothetical protein